MHSGNSTAEIQTGGALEASIASATRALLECRQSDGHWVFELEADCTIPAEYVLLGHFLVSRSIANWNARSQITCVGYRALMVAGRWCTRAFST